MKLANALNYVHAETETGTHVLNRSRKENFKLNLITQFILHFHPIN